MSQPYTCTSPLRLLGDSELEQVVGDSCHGRCKHACGGWSKREHRHGHCGKSYGHDRDGHDSSSSNGESDDDAAQVVDVGVMVHVAQAQA